MAENQPHRRRIHYKGTHPHHFSEKYKELNPEQYADTVEKVIRKGNTPAGMHISIMVQEILDFLSIQPGQQGLDATLGYGGHTLAMLEKLNHTGRIYGLDVDPIESEKTRLRLEQKGFGPEDITVRLINFANIDRIAAEAGRFDFVLADLGVSSMQIDDPSRGFSFKTDGPLDLRLDPAHGISAAQRLETVDRDELEGMLIENSDEPYAAEITDEIFRLKQAGQPILTTRDLYRAVEAALSFIPQKDRKTAVKKSCQRTFQALRIDINSEFEVLYQFLEKLPHILKPGGRAAILTFHSGEDRLVKKSFKEMLRQGLYSDIARDVIRPTPEECRMNPRATSTKMRWAIRSDCPD